MIFYSLRILLKNVELIFWLLFAIWFVKRIQKIEIKWNPNSFLFWLILSHSFLVSREQTILSIDSSMIVGPNESDIATQLTLIFWRIKDRKVWVLFKRTSILLVNEWWLISNLLAFVANIISSSMIFHQILSNNHLKTTYSYQKHHMLALFAISKQPLLKEFCDHDVNDRMYHRLQCDILL